jgi:hypothetical protein
MVLLPCSGCCGEWSCAMPQECVDALVGACCLPDGSCTQVNQWECDALGGTFAGPGLPCTADICDPCTDCNTPCTDCEKAYPAGYTVTFQVLETIAGGNTTDATAIADATGRVEAVTFDSAILSGSFFSSAKARGDCAFGSAPNCQNRTCENYNNGDWFLVGGTGEAEQGGKILQYCDPEPGVVLFGGQIYEYMTTAEWDAICVNGNPQSLRRWSMSFEPAAGYGGGGAWEFKKMGYPSPCDAPVQPVVVLANVQDVLHNTQNPEGTSVQTVVRFRAAITLTPIPYTP